MIFGKLNRTKEELKVYFDEDKDAGVNLTRSSVIHTEGGPVEYEFHMRFFYIGPTGRRMNFGNYKVWRKFGRKDFLARKDEVEEMIVEFLNNEKEFVLTKIFEE